MMQVLFLATGATRRRGVAAEAGAIAGAGGKAVVVVQNEWRWRHFPFDPRVEIVDIQRFGWTGVVLRIERLLLYRGPRAVVWRLGRGPLEKPLGFVLRVYERFLANPVHRRLFMPVFTRLMYRRRIGIIEKQVLTGRTFDLIVVADAASMIDAVRVLDGYTARGEPTPPVVFGVDHAGLDLAPAA